VDDYLSEKEQIQKIKQWLKENGPFVVAGLVLGIGGLAGWNYWQSYKISRAERAGAAYQAVVAAVEKSDTDAAVAELDALIEEYSATPYANQGRLMLARMHVEQGQLDAAAGQLEEVVSTTRDTELERIARVRLARVLLAADRASEALNVLDLSRAGSFAPRFHELRGDVLVARGERQAASEEYRLALEGTDEGVIDRQMVRMKLEALGSASGDGAGDA
jgi:predicted negative regulator of RcsB-dependent stress response